MKKYIFIILIFMLGTIFIGCDNNNIIEEELITHEELFDMYRDTYDQYIISQNANIYMEINNDDNALQIEYIYNLSGVNLKDLKYISKINNEVFEAYVNEQIRYVNFNGNKTKSPLDVQSEQSLITDYSFVSITEEFFKVFSEDLIKCLVVKSENNNIVKLEWDSSLIENDEYRVLSENITKISVNMIYKDGKISKIEMMIIKNTTIYNLLFEFRGLDYQLITLPDDIESYLLKENK